MEQVLLALEKTRVKKRGRNVDHNFRHKTRTRTVRVRFLWRSFGARIRTLFLFLSFSGALKHLFRLPAARPFPSGLYLHPYSPSAVHRTCGFRSMALILCLFPAPENPTLPLPFRPRSSRSLRGFKTTPSR